MAGIEKTRDWRPVFNSRKPSYPPWNKVRTTQPSQAVLISLSILMLLFSSIAFKMTFSATVRASREASLSPALTSGRQEVSISCEGCRVETDLTWVSSQDGNHFIVDRARAPIHYLALHAFPAILWSIALPMQHSSWLRARSLRLHRICGYTVLLSALTLSLSGLAMPLRNLAYTSSNVWELHSLSLNPHSFPLLAPLLKTFVRWPTFQMALYVFSPPFFFTAYRTFATIVPLGGQTSDLAQHSLWASAHAITGSIIPIQRLVQALLIFSARSFHHHFDPSTLEWLGLPDARQAETCYEKMRIVKIEQAAFAATMWVAMALGVCWFVRNWRGAGKPRMRVY